MKVQRSVLLLVVLSTSLALGEGEPAAAAAASSLPAQYSEGRQRERRLKKKKKKSLRGGVDIQEEQGPASREATRERYHDALPNNNKRALGNKKKKTKKKKTTTNNANAEVQTHIEPEMEMELAGGNKMFLGTSETVVWGESTGGDGSTTTGGGVVHHQPVVTHEAAPKTGGGDEFGDGDFSLAGRGDVFHSDFGSAEIENKLGLNAPSDGMGGMPIPIDEGEPLDLSGGGLELEPADNRLDDGAVVGGGGGGVILTGTGTGGGVVVHAPNAEAEAAPTNRGGTAADPDLDDSCSSVPDSVRGTVPPANTGKNVLVEAPSSTWAECDVMCQGYPDACAHRGYFYTLGPWGNRDRNVRACMDLTGLSFGARTGCQQGMGNPLP